MIIHYAFYILASIVNSPLHAHVNSPWKNVENLKCDHEFQSLMIHYGWDKETFSEQVSSTSKKRIFHNFSHTIGDLIEIRIIENSAPEALLLKNSRMTHVRFNNNCAVESVPESWPSPVQKVFTTKTLQDWTNEDLKSLVKSGKRGIIYSWSPKFAYSVLEMPRFEKMAKRLGYEFTAVVDPSVPESEVEATLDLMNKKKLFNMKRSLANRSFYRNVSTDIYMRGGFNHFPMLYIHNNKRIHPRWISGSITDNSFKELARTFAGELK